MFSHSREYMCVIVRVCALARRRRCVNCACLRVGCSGEYLVTCFTQLQWDAQGVDVRLYPFLFQ